MEGNLLYSRSTDLNVNLNNTFIATSRWMFEQKLGTVAQSGWHIKLSMTGREEGSSLSHSSFSFSPQPATKQNLKPQMWWWWVRATLVGISVWD